MAKKQILTKLVALGLATSLLASCGNTGETSVISSIPEISASSSEPVASSASSEQTSAASSAKSDVTSEPSYSSKEKTSSAAAVYTVTYNLDGGTNSEDNPTSYTAGGSAIVLQPATKDGYTFAGWFTSASLASFTKIESISITKTGNLTLYAKWEAKQYNITLHYGDIDTKDAVIQVAYQGNYNLPLPMWHGHSFLGWFDGDTEWKDGTWDRLGDLELTAKWEVVDYTISYSVGEGTNDESNPDSYNYDSDEIILGSPSLQGYTFKGWYTSDHFDEHTKVETIPTHSYGDLTLYAKWEGNQYQITLQYNDGVTEDQIMDVTYQGAYTLPVPMRQNFNFLGWYDGDEKWEGGIYTLMEGKTLSAKWEAVEFTITYVGLEDGTNNPNNPAGYNVETEDITLQDPQRNGYVFRGWYKTDYYADDTQVTSIPKGSMGSITLYAKWELASYAIVFDYNWGDYQGWKPKERIDLNYQDQYSLPGDVFMGGYNFRGWFDEDGNKWELSGQFTLTRDVTLTAHWEAKTYSVSLDPCESNYTGELTINATYGEKVVIPTPTKAGYSFDGWYNSGSSLRLQAIEGEDDAFIWNMDYCNGLVANWIPDGMVVEEDYGSYRVTDYTGNATELSLPIYYQGTYLTYQQGSLAKATSLQTLIFNDSPQMFLGHYFGASSYQENAQYVPASLKQLVLRKGYAFEHYFNGCTSLRTVTLGSEFNYIYDYAFSGCYNILEVVNHSYLPIQAGAYDYGQIASNAIRVITDESQSGFSEQDGFVIYSVNSNDVRLVGYTGNATELVIPDNVTSIVSGAFANNTSITSVSIPSTVTSIDVGILDGCTSLVSLTTPLIGGKTIGYYFGEEYYSPSNENNPVPSSLKTIRILDGCEEIPYYAFIRCTGLETLYIPSSVRRFDAWAFTLDPADGVTVNALYVDVYSITDLVSHQGFAQFPEVHLLDVNHQFEEITNLVIPNGTETIGYGALSNCKSLESVVIPNSVTSMPQYVFQGCTSLRSLTLPFIGESTDSHTYLSYLFGRSYETYPDYSFEETYVPESLTEVIVSDGCTSIGEKAFAGCTHLTSVILPSTLESIGAYAFFRCTALSSFQMPTGLNALGNYAFAYTALTSITLPSSLASIPYWAFAECTSLASVIIPSGATSIGSGAFHGCVSLASVTLPTTLTEIRESTFYHCSSLQSITLPSGLLSIGNSAFYGCTFLSSVNLSDTLTTIGDSAFENCSALASITFPDALESIGARAFCYTALETVVLPEGLTSLGALSFAGCISLTTMTLPLVGAAGYGIFCSYYYDAASCPVTSITIIGGATAIPNDAFRGMERLVSVTLPSTITSIGESAFEGCSSLSSLNLPEGLLSIGQNAFYGVALTSIAVPNSVTFIGSGAFSGNAALACLSVPFLGTSASSPSTISSIANDATALTTVAITGNISTLASNAFAYSSSIQSVTLPDSITTIGGYAFELCSALVSVNLPSSLTSIGSYAFDGCNQLVININSARIASIGSYAFRDCRLLGSVTLTGESIYIGEGAFNGCSALSSLTINAANLTIGNLAFYDCSALSTLVLSGAGAIGDSAFTRCTSLQGALTIPTGITSLGSYAFSDCSSLTSVYVPTTVVSIGQSAFFGCSSLVSVTLPFVGQAATGDYTIFGNIFGVAAGVPSGGGYYNKDYVPSSLKEVVILEGQTSLSDGAFQGCSNLVSITLPDSMTTIGSYAFADCSSLRNIRLSEAVTSIAGGFYDSAFNGCSSLASITLPRDLETFDSEAFRFCYRLAEIINHSSLNITTSQGGGDYQFSVKQVVTDDADSKVSIDENGCVLYTDGNDVTYIAYVGSGTDIVIPEGVTELYKYAFAYLDNLTSLTLPSTLTSFGENAFKSFNVESFNVYGNCNYIGATGNPYFYLFGATSTDITDITIHEDCKFIAEQAFHHCALLTSIVLPEGILSIGKGAFYGCAGLESLTLPYVGLSADVGCTFRTLFDVEGYLQVRPSNLREVTILGGTTIVPYAFMEFGTIATIHLPSTILTIQDWAFYGCFDLTSINLPSGLTYIGQYAFHDSHLDTIVVPSTVVSIGLGAFAGGVKNLTLPFVGGSRTENTYLGYIFGSNMNSPYGYSLERVEITSGITSLSENAFRYCQAYQIIIPDTVTSIGQNAFYQCNRLRQFSIPAGVQHIPNSAFFYCYALTSIEVPSSVISIGSQAFYHCNSLASITLPSGLSTIGDSAFSGCGSLLEIVNHSALEIIAGEYNFQYGELGRYALQVISDPAQTKLSTDENGCILYRDGSDIYYVSYPGLAKDIIIPDGVTHLCTRGLYRVSSDAYTSITLPDTLVKIGQYAFSGVTANIIWGDNPAIKEIGRYAFANYQGQSLVLPDGVTTIRSYAFSNTSCPSITISKTVVSIEASAFDWCTSEVLWAEDAAITTIGSSAFQNFFGPSLTLPLSVRTYSDSAFLNAHFLESFTIGTNVTTFGQYVFRDCTSLHVLTYEGTMAQWNAMTKNVKWANCSALTSIHCSDGDIGITPSND